MLKKCLISNKLIFNRFIWKCVCDCGNEKIVVGDNNTRELRTGVTKSLGVAKCRVQQFPQLPIC